MSRFSWALLCARVKPLPTGGELSGKEFVLVTSMILAGLPAYGFLSSACLGFLTCPIAEQKVTAALYAKGSTFS